jgi:hypothetical protein
MDLVYLALIMVFLLALVGMARGCARLLGGPKQ